MLGKRKNIPEINRRFVYAMRTIGQGHAAMTTFCGVMDFPPPVAEKSYNNIINKLQLCSKEVAEASMQSAALKRKGVTCLQKVENLTLKNALKNHNGSAGMMETVGMVHIFQRSLSHRSVRYTSTSGMAIPKHFPTTTASNCMEKISQFQKIECVGHVQKRMGTRLRKLKQNELQTQ
ncbi:uncharacterized protein TNCV_4557731 [Trichonephila clavipes]|nr:uncharacterized protein TNCV_4557731 [Trichonephila clavipes]